jgi:DNA replication initiation complex subunit (GINS family)
VASPEVGEHKDTIRSCFEKIYSIRANKIIHYSGRDPPGGRPPENIISEEMPLYKKLMELVVENRSSVLDQPVENKADYSKTMVKVRIITPMPALMGSDEKEYGPFKADDTVEIPEDLAKLLIDKKVAE